MPALRRLALVLVATLAAAAVAATAPRTRAADDDRDAGSTPSDLRTVAGKVSAVAWPESKLTIDAADGPLTLQIDRNTTVFLDNRLGTLRDVVMGAPVRAEYGPGNRAFWIEVRSRAVMPGGGRADGGADEARASRPELPMPPPEPDAGVARAGPPRDAGTGSVADPGLDGGPPPATGSSDEPPAVAPPPTSGPAPQPPIGPGPVPGGPVRH